MGAWSTAWRFSNSNVMILHADAFGKGPCELWTRKLEWWKKVCFVPTLASYDTYF